MSGTQLTGEVTVHPSTSLEIISPISREGKEVQRLSFLYFSFSCFQKRSFGFLTGLHVFRKVLLVTVCFHFISFVLEPRICLVAQPDLSLVM